MIASSFRVRARRKSAWDGRSWESFPEARAAFEEADGAFGDEPPALSTLCFDGLDDRPALTEITQPAMLTASIAACRVLQSRRASSVRGRTQPW